MRDAGFTGADPATNGSGRQRLAQVRLAGRPHLAPVPQRAMKLAGQLLDSQQHPIAGATLDVLAKAPGQRARA